jgi:signal transduction histidine kinase
MRLATFIRSSIESIAAEWELFAKSLLPEAEFSKSVLRDGIADILAEIAADMERGQSDAQQKDKSEGQPRRDPQVDNGAERHALARVKMGLSARQVISEFRALRATVIRMWHRNATEFDDLSLYDLTRFNEAVDQALTEAAVGYTFEVEKSRELFLGILGHDLRNPLAAISGLARLQLNTKHSDRHQHFARRSW